MSYKNKGGGRMRYDRDELDARMYSDNPLAAEEFGYAREQALEVIRVTRIASGKDPNAPLAEEDLEYIKKEHFLHRHAGGWPQG